MRLRPVAPRCAGLRASARAERTQSVALGCIALHHVAWCCKRSVRNEPTGAGKCEHRTSNIQHRTPNVEVNRMRNEPTGAVVSGRLSVVSKGTCAMCGTNPPEPQRKPTAPRRGVAVRETNPKCCIALRGV